jgi:cytoskeletal protein RodZ
MPTVAEQLRQAREAQKLDIYHVAEITKIKTDHVRALESGHYDVFTAPVYVRGFVRTYASMLKLDVPRVMADLDAELKQTERFSEPPALTQRSKGPLDFVMLQLSKLNWRIAVALLVVLVALYFGAMWFRSYSKKNADPHRNLGPGLYQPPANRSGETLPLPPADNKR